MGLSQLSHNGGLIGVGGGDQYCWIIGFSLMSHDSGSYNIVCCHLKADLLYMYRFQSTNLCFTDAFLQYVLFQ